MATEYSWSFEWRVGWDLLQDAGLMELWKRLAQSCNYATVFQSPVMTKAWLDTIGRAERVTPVVLRAVEASTGSQALLSLCLWPGTVRNLGQRCLLAAGFPNFDCHVPLVENAEHHPPLLQAFWRDLGRHFQSAVRWCDVAAVGRVPQVLGPPDAPADPSTGAPVVALRGLDSLESYLSTRSRSHRGDIGRQMRRLRDRGDVCLRVFGHVDLGDAREELQGLFNAHRQEWRSRGQRSPFEAHEIRLFYERLLGDLLPSGVLHLSVLRTGRVSVSWHFGFECHGVLHYYKPAFSPDYANLSPGKVHLAMLIEEGIRRGWSRIDLGPGMENYKLLWTSDVLEMSQPVWHTHTFRNHLRGWAKQGLARLGVGASGTPLA